MDKRLVPVHTQRMDMKLEAFEAIVKRAFALRMPEYKLCEAAGVSITTMTKWRKGTSPTVTTLGKLERALDKLEKEKVS